MNIVRTLLAQADIVPDQCAFTALDKGRERSVTFLEFSEASARAAGYFNRLGLRAGQSVLILEGMSIDLYVALVGLFRLGVTALFLDPSAGRRHIENCCRMYPPDALLARDKAHLLRLISPALRKIPLKLSMGLKVPFSRRWEKYVEADSFDSIVDEMDRSNRGGAIMTFTSGSTGQPKAVVRSHAFLLEQHAVLEKELALVRGERDLTTLPVFALANLGSGVTTVIPDADLRRPGFINAERVLAQIDRINPDRTAGSPAFYQCLLTYCRKNRDYSILRKLKKVYTGGAPVFPGFLDELASACPDTEICVVYGSTEAEPITHLVWSKAKDVARSQSGCLKGLPVGQPIDAIECRVIRDHWGHPLKDLDAKSFDGMTTGPCESGEIVVAGKHVLSGYFNPEADRETKFRVDGQVWHRSGDAGYFDASGQLWMTGRCAARVTIDDRNFYPLEIECPVNGISGMHRSAFLEAGGKPVLVYVPDVQVDTETLEKSIKALLEQLGIHPDRVLLMQQKQIPLDQRHNAKIDYPALQKQLA